MHGVTMKFIGFTWYSYINC